MRVADLIKIEDVIWSDRCVGERNLHGTLYITNTHTIFVSTDGKELWIPHFQIASVQRTASANGVCRMELSGKTFFVLNFLLKSEADCQNAVDSLVSLSRAGTLEELPAFSHVPHLKELAREEGWNETCVQEDFARLGLPNDKWTISDLNKNFDYCEGYPEWFYVPKHVPAPVLIGSLKFRSRGRLPVLSYLHPNEACICRCSQPLAGFSARCIEDESLTRHIAKTNPNSKTLYIVDTRPMINAMVNRVAGKGFEDERNYNSVRYHFFAVENIHAVRTSLQKMLEVIGNKKNMSMSNYLTGMVNSGWLKHISTLLEAAVFISQAILSGTSVLVHCSDGWDRTPQTISLACIMLDGWHALLLKALVEKEWLLFGHKFTHRAGHLYTDDPKEVAPIFAQFLDAIWQLMEQFPTEFEFNEHYLITLHDHLHSCEFGTFLGNSHKERLDLKLSSRTYSLWGFLQHKVDELRNPLYNPNKTVKHLSPDLRPHQINLWRSMYNRYDVNCREEILLGTVVAYKQQTESLKMHISFLNGLIEKLVELNSVRPANQNSSEDICEKLLNSSILSGGGSKEDVQVDGEISLNTNSGDSDSCHEKKSLETSITGDLAKRSTVALDWKQLTDAISCSNTQCGATFWLAEAKRHCWGCGLVFCAKCTGFTAPLPGHGTSDYRPVPLCQKCSLSLSNYV